MYKMMKALSGYGDSVHGQIEITDDSENDEQPRKFAAGSRALAEIPVRPTRGWR